MEHARQDLVVGWLVDIHIAGLGFRLGVETANTA
jgi:hypothetical protein